MSFHNEAGRFLPIPDEVLSEVAEATSSHCEECPVQCDLASELGSQLLTKYVIQNFVAEALTGAHGEAVNELIDAQVPGEYAEDAKRSVRQRAASELDEVDDLITSIKGEMDSNSQSCDGVLKMRAGKEGKIYTASICTSGLQYPHSMKNHLSAHVTMTPSAEQ